MPSITLSTADLVFMLFVIITLVCLATRRDAILPTSVGLFAVGCRLERQHYRRPHGHV